MSSGYVTATIDENGLVILEMRNDLNNYEYGTCTVEQLEAMRDQFAVAIEEARGER